MSTAISWTNETWNPVTGCSRVSEGCRNCYAERLSLERGWSTLPWTAANAAQNVRLHPERLRKPAGWKTPRRVFVNSMSDLFHPQVPDEFVDAIFAVMCSHPQHTFQVLTKRPERAAQYRPRTGWPPHIWMGTSVEDQRSAAERIPHLIETVAPIRFLSCEPLLGPIDLAPWLDRRDLDGGLLVDWVIVGGESGAQPREMSHAWVWPMRDACVRNGVAFFFKQSSARRTEMGTSLAHQDGSFWKWAQYPGDLRPGEPGGAHRLTAFDALPLESRRSSAR